MAKQTDNDVNLNFLRIRDSKTQTIILNCGQSALYEFVTGSWKRKNIEGTLFIVERSEAPLFKIIIPNKLPNAEVDVFQETITDGYEMNLEEPYALCKNADNVINCFWFYKKEMCQQFESAVKACIQIIKEQNEKRESLLNSSLNKLNIANKSTVPTAQTSILSAAEPNFPATVTQMLSLEDIEKDTFNASRSQQQQPQPKSQPKKTPKVEPSFAAQVLPEVINAGGDLSMNSTIGSLFSRHGRQSVKLEDLMIPSQQPVQQPAPQPQPQPQPQPIQQQPQHNGSITIPTQAPVQASTKISLEELKQTMIHLLQNDADFLFAVYETYKARVSNLNNHK